jgi:acylphosphatase
MISHLASPQKKLHLVIHGRVQGVFFRESMRQEAQRLGVSGWVKNRNDGSVEAAVHGDTVAVDALVGWAQRGPELAHVERVDIAPDDGSYKGFEVIR